MKNTNSSTSAHPVSVTSYSGGLTKREYFALAAMTGLCNAHNQDGTWWHDPKTVAVAAVDYADALLAQLDQ